MGPATGVSYWGTPLTDIQSGVAVANNAITGTLKYLDTGALVTDWGEGNFIALKFTDLDPDAVSVRVGLEPSQGSGLVEIINDPDKDGVFKVTNKNTQKFKVVQETAEGETRVQRFDLSGLTCETE